LVAATGLPDDAPMRAILFATLLLASPTASATTLDAVHDWMRAGRGEAVVAALTTLLPTLDPAAQDDARFTIGRLLVEEGRPKPSTTSPRSPRPSSPSKTAASTGSPAPTR
jgi:hypothetical protein